MGRLPTELVDRILLDLDEKTLGVLYDRGTLKDMVSAPAAREIENKVLRQAREEHQRLLSMSLECLPWHVWQDGTPMTRHAVHYLRTSALDGLLETGELVNKNQQIRRWFDIFVSTPIGYPR